MKISTTKTNTIKKNTLNFLAGIILFSTTLIGSAAVPQPTGLIVLSPQSGVDMGQQIAACVAQLTQVSGPSATGSGGICDARAFTGVQYNLAGGVLSIGAPGQPVELLLGRVTLYTNQVIQVQQGSSIVGMPGANFPKYSIPNDVPGVLPAVGFAASIIKQYPGSNLNAVVELDGGFNFLQDLVVDGGKDKNTSGVAILVNRASRVQMVRVVAQFAPSYGISFYSNAPGTNVNRGNESCCAKLQSIMSLANGDSGLYAVNTADVFIALSEFENNGGSGIELCDSPTFRIEHSDVGGNALDGIRIYGDNKGFGGDREIIVGNQFGNNQQDDIHIYGTAFGHQISSNNFIGSGAPYYRKTGSDGIRISGSNNVILGNIFYISSEALHACIEVVGTSTGNMFNANLCQPHPNTPVVTPPAPVVWPTPIIRRSLPASGAGQRAGLTTMPRSASSR